MSQFTINGEHLVTGEMTLTQEAVDKTIRKAGAIKLNKYFDEIKTIQNDYLLIEGITVINETIGTKDKEVAYEFVATEVFINEDAFNREGGEQNG